MPRRRRNSSLPGSGPRQEATGRLRQGSSVEGRGAKDGSALPLSHLRRVAGVTQTSLARRLGLNQATLSRLERSRDPRVGSLRRFTGALGAELDLHARFADGRSVRIDTGGPDSRRRSAPGIRRRRRV